jgi:small subunit ribosomal protein S4
MEKRSTMQERGVRSGERSEQRPSKRARKLTEYGKQLQEKQKVKEMYGMRESQFRRFFANATKSQEATSEALLVALERRLDNVLFRLKGAISRRQSRQLIVHGHVTVNGKKVYSPSYLVSVGDEIGFAPGVENKTVFVEQVIDKRLQSNAKVADWLELDKKSRKGRVLRMPVRMDIHTPIEEYLIVELYSK